MGPGSGAALVPYKETGVGSLPSIRSGRTLDLDVLPLASDMTRPSLSVALSRVAMCQEVAVAAQMLPESLHMALHAALARRVGEKARRGLGAQEQKSSRTMSKGVRL